ncbi:hypothetical protein [Nocardia sp. NPDC051832]
MAISVKDSARAREIVENGGTATHPSAGGFVSPRDAGGAGLFCTG